jgi:hypothetical protein
VLLSVKPTTNPRRKLHLKLYLPVVRHRHLKLFFQCPQSCRLSSH